MQYPKRSFFYVLTAIILSVTHFALFVSYITKKKDNASTDRVAILYFGSYESSLIQQYMKQHTFNLASELNAANRPTSIVGVRFPKSTEKYFDYVVTTPTQLSTVIRSYDHLIIQYQHDAETKLDDQLFRMIKYATAFKSVITTLYHGNESLIPTTHTLTTVRKLAHYSDHVVVTSETSAEALKVTHALQPNSIHFIPYNGAEYDDIRYDSAAKSIITFACFDRIGLDQLLSAFQQTFNSTVLQVVVCDAAMYSDFKVAKNRENVRVIEERYASHLYNHAALYVHLPLKFPEIPDAQLHKVMQAGLPVISIDYGYPGEILFNEEGSWWDLLADYNSTTMMSQKLKDFFDKPVSERERMGARNRDRIKQRGSIQQLEPAKQYIALMESGTLPRRQRNLACNPASPYAISFTRSGYINHGFMDTVNGNRFMLKDIIPNGARIINIVTDPILQINGHITEDSYVDQVGVMWFDGKGKRHYIILETYRQYFVVDGNKMNYENLGYNGEVSRTVFEDSQLSVVLLENDATNGMSVKIEIEVASGRYMVELAVHKIPQPRNMEWIDVMLNVQDNMAAAHGLLGQSVRSKFDLSSAPIEGYWQDYEVKDGILGTKFKYNLFLVDNYSVNTIPEKTDCGIPYSFDERGELEKKTIVLSDNPHLTTSGFSTGSRELVLELLRSTNFKMMVRDIYDHLPPLSSESDRIEPITSRMASDEQIIQAKPDVAFRMRGDLGKKFNDSRNIYYTPWEYRGMLVPEAREAASTDHVWAITRYVRQCYIDAGIPERKIAIVPHGVHKEAFTFPDRDQPVVFPELTGEDFVFLFRGGGYPRKGLDLLVKSFMEEFTSKDDVTLIIHTSYGLNDFTTPIKEMVANRTSNHPRIIYSEAALTDDESIALYHEVNCYLSPYRSEGFGLTITEAMAASLPVILTDYSGPRDFANPANAYLIPATETECHVHPCKKKAFYHFPMTQQAMWAEPSTTDLRKLLRHVTVHRAEAATKGKIARKFFAFILEYGTCI
jgi:glycosyltransferase involved in cell wall biosynthesis